MTQKFNFGLAVLLLLAITIGLGQLLVNLKATVTGRKIQDYAVGLALPANTGSESAQITRAAIHRHYAHPV